MPREIPYPTPGEILVEEFLKPMGITQYRLAKEIGVPDLLDKIADESVATSSEDLLAYLEKVAHPALTMEPII